MKKFIFIFFIFILVVSIFIIKIQTNPHKDSAAVVLTGAFEMTGARAVSSEIYMQGRLDPGYSGNVQEQQQLLCDIIGGVGGNVDMGKPVFVSIDTDLCTGLQTDYIINDFCSIHVSILKEKQKNDLKESRITISLTDTSIKPGLDAASAELLKKLEKYEINPSINLCITGSIDGTLDKNRLKDLCNVILESTAADMVEEMDDNGLVSVTAFSPSIDNVIHVNGKQINLNVAVRYNSYEGRTYIWLATPVITTEY